MQTQPNNNYAPPKSAVADLATDSADAERASRSSRFWASFVDGLVISLPFAPSYVAAFPAIKVLMNEGHANAYSIWAEMSHTGALFYGGLLVSVLLWVVIALLVHRNGQSIGKKCLGIKDVRTDGSRAGFGRIFGLRYLVNTLLTMIPLIGSFYALVDVLMIFGSAKRCAHDYIADTIVVRA
jgi:uncharacterized RDD family membrane protein YckC